MLAPARLPAPLRVGAYLACFAVLSWLSLAPQTALPQPGLSDKFQHTIAYAVLAAAGVALFPARAVLTLALAFGFGLAIEGLQATMGFGRSGDWRDVIANSLGLLIVALPALWWRYRQARRR
jgi:VanZ family protein